MEATAAERALVAERVLVASLAAAKADLAGRQGLAGMAVGTVRGDGGGWSRGQPRENRAATPAEAGGNDSGEGGAIGIMGGAT